MMMAQRYRLYPTKEQETFFLQVSGCCRFVYNKALELHQKAYEKSGTSPSKQDMVKKIPSWKKEKGFLKQALSQPLQQAVHDLYDGFDRFFKGQNEKPTWRKHSDAPSFRLPQPKQFKIKNLPGTKKNVRHFSIPKAGMSGKLGSIKMVLHRPIEGKVKNATITREGTAWYVSFCVDIKGQLEHRQRKTMDAIEEKLCAGWLDELCITGVDRNVARNGSVVTNWGDVYGRVIKTKKLEEKQARLHRIVSRKEEALRKTHGIKPGGSLKGIERPNRLKLAQAKLRKFSAKLARVRKYVAHCISKTLVDSSDIIVFERLETKAMTSCEADMDALPWERARNKKTRKDILDVGWAKIEAFVKYKALKAGKMIVRVDPAYTSQRCCGCGHISKENRNDKNNTKHFECVQCGHTEDADVNAAKNIRFLGVEELKQKIQKLASGERLDRSRWRLEGSTSLMKSEESSSWVGQVPDGAGYANCSGNSGAA